MSTFVFRLKAPRPTFALDMSDEEREIMACHAAHWRPWIESGQMVIFGPVLDASGSWVLASWRPTMNRSCGPSPTTIRSLLPAPPRWRSGNARWLCPAAASPLADTGIDRPEN
jgi:hypothetical protein